MPEVEANPIGAFRYELVFTETKLGGASGGGTTKPIAGGAFAECTGLEATMEPKVIKEGGRNYGTHQRAGAVTFATVVLRRGMTPNTHLWAWFNQLTLQGGYAYRMDVDIRHLDLEGQVMRTWHLDRAMPVKFKSSDLSAKSAEIAIEELHLVHEGLQLR